MNHYERRKPVRTKGASFSVAGFIAERLAGQGRSERHGFRNAAPGHRYPLLGSGRFRELLLLTHELLARRGEFVTQRQRNLRDAIVARVIKAN